ncbi:hypothetical protein J6590_054686 [Homalodisca vitripennis]|nr:hypothetical protein J6590_054686 [Homalodisca vitripennis]
MEKELKNLLQDESEDAILARIQEESLRLANIIFTQGGVNTPPPPLQVSPPLLVTLFDQLTNPAQSVSFTAATRSVELCKQNCESETQSTQLINRYKKVLVPLPTPTPGRRGPLFRGTVQKFAFAQEFQQPDPGYYNEVELPRRAAENIENKEVTDHIQPQPHCSKNNDARFYNEVESPHRVAEEFQENGISDCEKLKTDQPHCSKTDGISQNTPVKDVFYKGCSQGADGFHLAAGETYVYPTNYPIRKYQKSIIHSALFHNTLVSLPTGLGKTFIAAVVMYNYYRWFPQGKIVFMAPTRPLVAQQIRACHDIMAIPIKDTIEMTGSMNPGDRLKQWKSKRVFFLTPQVMANDLRSGVCPATLFKCVVIDEAHRATKEYSYCHVIKELEKAGAMFRILALSATPGSNIKAVVEVVQNLRISTLELRGEDSPDVTPYTHAKQIEPVSLSLSKNILDFREQFLLIFERYARSLREARLVTCNVQNITKFQLLKASERIRSKPPNGMAKARVGILMADFTVCMTLAHGLELLQTYGLRAFHQYFTGCEDEENRKAAFTRLSQDVEFHQLMENLHKAVSSPMDQFWSHPKHEHLVKILKEHFSVNENQKEDSKVIIFCQYRVVVSEVYELLQKIHPSIKPIMFIGQGAGKDKTGLPQKKQIEVMKQFREGKSNVLIATCVAEEGLDIGSVDLLILMEVQRSPVRLVQRLGRTGRHRQGRCVVLLTQGREVQGHSGGAGGSDSGSILNLVGPLLGSSSGGSSGGGGDGQSAGGSDSGSILNLVGPLLGSSSGGGGGGGDGDGGSAGGSDSGSILNLVGPLIGSSSGGGGGGGRDLEGSGDAEGTGGEEESQSQVDAEGTEAAAPAGSDSGSILGLVGPLIGSSSGGNVQINISQKPETPTHDTPLGLQVPTMVVHSCSGIPRPIRVCQVIYSLPIHLNRRR